ncbi:MAG TPA: hypothetical protein VMT16_10740 [Thermoanaerobaculia bacterium]|nr:hypothetical protein [Thermoanaerobaculia bacterium]
MNDLAPVLAIVGFMAVLGWILRTFSDNRRRVKIAEAHAALHRDLLHKFGSSEELLAYLGSDAGRELLGTTALERPAPLARILGAVQAGILLTAVGAALFLARGLEGMGRDAYTGFAFLGILALAVGLGFLASAAASWALAAKLGLMASPRAPEPVP